MALDLSNYVDVPSRLRLALQTHPELRVVEGVPKLVADGKFLEVTVTVYRNAEDPLPTTGTAWEPFPGQTPYTRNSEMMNAATSALGRALGYMGFGLTSAISTAEEVAVRMAEKAGQREPQDPAGPIPRPRLPKGGMGTISEKQKAFLTDLMARKAHQHEGRDLSVLSREEAGDLIEELKACPDIK